MRIPSIFRGLFNKQKEQISDEPLKLEWVDMHSHLLPGIDDGCKTMDESLELLQRFADAGCRKVITTPHIMSDLYRNTPEIIHGKLEEVRQALQQRGINIEIEAAAEYYMDEFFSKLLEERRLLTFGDNYVLVETGFISESPTFRADIFNMQVAGYRPVLAHPERYLYYHDEPDKLKELMDRGILLQMNMMSLTGYYSPKIRKIAEYLVSNNMISFIGTDIHNSRHFDTVMQALKMPFYGKLPHEKLYNKLLIQ